MNVPCPNCRHDLRVRAEYGGKRITCKYCGNIFVAPAAPAPAGATVSGEATGALQRVVALEEELQQTRSELTVRTAEQERAVAGLREAQAETARLQEQVRELDSRLPQGEDQEPLSAQPEADLEAARAERDRLRGELEESQSRAACADELRQELQASRAQLEHLQLKLQAFQQTKEELRAARDHREELQK